MKPMRSRAYVAVEDRSPRRRRGRRGRVPESSEQLSADHDTLYPPEVARDACEMVSGAIRAWSRNAVKSRRAHARDVEFSSHHEQRGTAAIAASRSTLQFGATRWRVKGEDDPARLGGIDPAFRSPPETIASPLAASTRSRITAPHEDGDFFASSRAL